MGQLIQFPVKKDDKPKLLANHQTGKITGNTNSQRIENIKESIQKVEDFLNRLKEYQRY